MTPAATASLPSGLIESTTPHRSLTRSPWLQRREALIGPPIRRPGGQVRFLGVAYQDTP